MDSLEVNFLSQCIEHHRYELDQYLDHRQHETGQLHLYSNKVYTRDSNMWVKNDYSIQYSKTIDLIYMYIHT